VRDDEGLWLVVVCTLLVSSGVRMVLTQLPCFLFVGEAVV
jgi:hypothetical protein